MNLQNPLMSLPEEAYRSFPGQQEGERILYVIRPHWMMEVIAYSRVVFVAGALALGFWYTSDSWFVRMNDQLRMSGYIAIALAATLAMLWFRQYAELSRAYVTDRRFIRFVGAIPQWQSRRALFWNDVTKVRTYAPNMVCRLMKVGSVEALPNFDTEEENVRFNYVYYYGDLGSYLDKIVFTFRSKREEMDSIREFVPKPKGQRYPSERRV